MVDAVELRRTEHQAKPTQIDFQIGMNKPVVNGFEYANDRYCIRIGYLENEKGNECKQRSCQHVDDMSAVLCKHIQLLLRMMNGMKVPKGMNFMPCKVSKPN